MNIRKALESDASKVKDLVSSLSHFYLEDNESCLPEWFSKTLEVSEFEQRFSNKEFDNFLCSIDGVIVGYISIKEKSHVYHLFVAESYQGKGISRKLWNHATSYSDKGIYTVRSSMFAVPVYKRFGFKESGEIARKGGIAFQPMVLEY